MQLLKVQSFAELFLTSCREEVDCVVDFDTPVEHSGHERLPVRRPLNFDCTVRLCASDLLQGVQGPEVDLASQVAKAANHGDLRERTDSNRVSVAFAKLKQGLAVLVKQSCSRRLSPGNHNE